MLCMSFKHLIIRCCFYFICDTIDRFLAVKTFDSYNIFLSLQFVRDQIIQEYKYNKSNKRYLDARTRFAYMHKKLSHIKDLVAEFDKSLMHSTPDEVSGPGCMDEDEEALAFCR